MTRDQAQLKFLNVETDIINEIYDDFESRTCESCKHYIEQEFSEEGNCDVLTYPVWDEWSAEDVYLSMRVEINFGCNKWEAKQNKRDYKE